MKNTIAMPTIRPPALTLITVQVADLAIASSEPTRSLARSWPMQIREENRNIFLLAAVTLCCTVVAGTFELLEPAVAGQAPEKWVAENRPIDAAAEVPVRVVGAPFVPNLNPRAR